MWKFRFFWLEKERMLLTPEQFDIKGPAVDEEATLRHTLNHPEWNNTINTIKTLQSMNREITHKKHYPMLQDKSFQQFKKTFNKGVEKK